MKQSSTLAAFGDAAFDGAVFGDAAIGDATADSNPFGGTAFGDIALGGGTDLGLMLPLGRKVALALIQTVGSPSTFGIETRLWFSSPMRQKCHELPRSAIAPCSAIAADPFLMTLFLTTGDS